MPKRQNNNEHLELSVDLLERKKDWKKFTNFVKLNKIHKIRSLSAQVETSIAVKQEDFLSYFNDLENSRCPQNVIFSKYQNIKQYYSAKFHGRNLEQDFPLLPNVIKIMCPKEWKNSPENQKITRITVWNDFTSFLTKSYSIKSTVLHKLKNMEIEDFVNYFNYLKDHKKLSRNEIHETYILLQDYYQLELKSDLNTQFPFLFRNIKKFIFTPELDNESGLQKIQSPNDNFQKMNDDFEVMWNENYDIKTKYDNVKNQLEKESDTNESIRNKIQIFRNLLGQGGLDIPKPIPHIVPTKITEENQIKSLRKQILDDLNDFELLENEKRDMTKKYEEIKRQFENISSKNMSIRNRIETFRCLLKRGPGLEFPRPVPPIVPSIKCDEKQIKSLRTQILYDRRYFELLRNEEYDLTRKYDKINKQLGHLNNINTSIRNKIEIFRNLLSQGGLDIPETIPCIVPSKIGDLKIYNYFMLNNWLVFLGMRRRKTDIILNLANFELSSMVYGNTYLL